MITIEHTDTFGGEANYSWVNRYHHIMDPKKPLSKRARVRLAKKVTGLTGVRCRVTDFGDMIDIRPARICHVVFVGWDEPERADHHGQAIDRQGQPVE